jgi:hypothetical protein
MIFVLNIHKPIGSLNMNPVDVFSIRLTVPFGDNYYYVLSVDVLSCGRFSTFWR